MKSSLYPLQKALYARLSEIMPKVTGVYDYVPETAVAPYISLGEDTAVPWDTKDIAGEEITVTLHCWSEYRGKKETKEILGLMLEKLSEPLQLETGHTLSFSNWESSRVLDDPDGVTKHGILRMTFKTKG